MRIGLISDIHGYLSQEAADALAGVDRLLCLGDVEDQRIFWQLDTIAPCITVMGNCDRYAGLTNLPFTAAPVIDGVRFFMVHRPEDAGTPAPNIHVVLHGHTHIPRDQQLGRVRYINPGSPTNPRGGSNPSVAIITTEEGAIEQVEFISLATASWKSLYGRP